MSKLSAKYQFCAIHTADTTDGIVRRMLESPSFIPAPLEIVEFGCGHGFPSNEQWLALATLIYNWLLKCVNFLLFRGVPWDIKKS